LTPDRESAIKILSDAGNTARPIREGKTMTAQNCLLADHVAVDSALVGQKDAIIGRINRAEDYTGLDAAAALLSFAAPLWDANGYGYKVREIRERIRNRATELAGILADTIIYIRKTSSDRAKAEHNLANLRSLSGL
jgi:hypothetical protein